MNDPRLDAKLDKLPIGTLLTIPYDLHTAGCSLGGSREGPFIYLGKEERPYCLANNDEGYSSFRIAFVEPCLDVELQHNDSVFSLFNEMPGGPILRGAEYVRAIDKIQICGRMSEEEMLTHFNLEVRRMVSELLKRESCFIQ